MSPRNLNVAPHKLPVPFVLVSGGKGGVGKTTVTAHLGAALGRAGHRVLLVDLDLGLANLDIALGLGVVRDIEDALTGRCRFSDCLVEGPGGVHLLPASSGNEAMGRHGSELRERLLAGLLELSRDYDIVLGDSAAGIGPDVMDFAAVAQRVLVVTSPHVASLTDAYGLLKALDQHGAKRGLDIPTPEIIVNTASGVEEAASIARKLRSMCERFLARSPRDAGWLPLSDRLQPGPRGELPAVSLEASCLRRLATRLARMVGECPALGGPVA